MTTVNVLRDHLPHHAADEDVRIKMLPRPDARIAHERSQTIRENFGYWPRIFVGYYPSHRPRCRGMLRRERRASAKKWTTAVALKRPLSPQRVLQRLNRNQTIDGRLARQKPGFPPMLAMRRITQEPHRCCAPD